MPDQQRGVPDSITFDRGLNTRKAPMMLEDGELVTAQGLSYDSIGSVTPRSSKEKGSTTQIGTIRGIHRNLNSLVVVDGDNVRYKWDLDAFCDLYVPPNADFTSVGKLSGSGPPNFCNYNEFLFISSPPSKKAFINGNLYEWGIDAPTEIPRGTAGASGEPNDTYSLYYTYLVYFPNGQAVETSPSPAGSVTVASQKIEWSNIAPCPYGGSGLTIHRKLYRYSTTLIETYYVATIADNTTTTYSDNFSDDTLEIHEVCSTEDYSPPPTGTRFAVYHIERVFAIQGSYVYPSESYMPFTFDHLYRIQVTTEGDDLTGGVAWGGSFYVTSKSRWYRIAGGSSATWEAKGTYSETGCVSGATIIPTQYGIIHLWHDGIYLFDGQISKNITVGKLADSVFSAISSYASCYASWDGRRYYLHYPISGTTLSKRLVLDFSRSQDILIHNDDFIPTAHQYDMRTGIHYYGYNGYHYKEGGSDTVALSIKTGDRIVKNLFQQKQLEYLYYDIDTGGQEVIVKIYIDDILAFTKAITTTSREKERVLLPQKQGYRYYMTITAADGRGVTIYEPWAISVNYAGV